MTTSDGGPAFPRPAGVNPHYHTPGQEGMSLRDWLAGMAMQGIVAASGIQGFGVDYKDDVVARNAYILADHMLAERAKEGAQ